ncbi:MAG TPA: 4Fe-4S dicluster domain-containing protein, partial [Ottowia sp.]|nr:4Fe-4S dicluster domain-containing protein [Ottowia sp.]
ACTRVCPSGALALERATAPGAPDRFVLDMRRCTGCGLCHDVCTPQALSIPQALSTPRAPTEHEAAPGPDEVLLTRLSCPACRVDFHQPAGAQREPTPCCPTCRQGRPRQHNRLVQQDCPP